jgi:transposase
MDGRGPGRRCCPAWAVGPVRRPTKRYAQTEDAYQDVEALTGRHRWVVERTMSWLNGCRRLHRRYERKAEHFPAFVGIASALICYRRYTN